MRASARHGHAPCVAAQSLGTQPLRSRTAIVAAGPAANLLLAILLYAAVNWLGVEEPQPVLGTPLARHSIEPGRFGCSPGRAYTCLNGR